MTVEVILFLFGGLLILTSIFGGGFEVKEVKLPKGGSVARGVAGLVGAVFVLLGIGAEGKKGQGAAESTARETIVVRASSVDENVNPAQHQGQHSTFSGIHGQAVVEWVTEGVQYAALIQVSGATGVATVKSTAFRATIHQDLDLRQSGDHWFYVGSDPRTMHDGRPTTDYMPDAFRLAPSPGGGVGVDAVCSGRTCSPAAMRPVP